LHRATGTTHPLEALFIDRLKAYNVSPMGQSDSIDKQWLPDSYYERAARRRVWSPFHFVCRKALCGVIATRQGRPIVEAPNAVYELDGPVIVASTHRSWLDIPVAVEATEKVGIHHVRPVAKAELFQNPAVGALLHRLGAIAVVRQNPNFDGLNMAFSSLLERGSNVLVYTEGTRIRENVTDVLKPKRTAALLSLTNRVPIVPLAIAGVADEEVGGRLNLGTSVAAVFGEPIYPSTMEANQNELSGRDLLSAARVMGTLLHQSMQAAMNRAYALR
jgi:1-acyl-sn-glycerol-3-phosphate acyltransferase